MPISVMVDDKSVEQAREFGQHETDEEAVAAALDEYVKRLGRLKILDLVGKVEYYDDYDYKAGRRKKRE